MRGQLGEVGIHVLVSGALCHHAPECLVDAVVHELLIDRIAVLQKPCLQHGLDDGVRLGILQACQCRHNSHLQLGRRSRSDRLSGHLVPAGLRIEELPVLLEAAPERRRLGDAHLVHPHGDQIGTELLTVQLHVQQPVILVGLIGEGTVHQIVAGGIVHGQQLLHIEVVGAGERDDLGPAQRDLIQFVHELLILVDPDDDPALIELRQRCRKPTVQVLYYLFGIHIHASSFPIGYSGLYNWNRTYRVSYFPAQQGITSHSFDSKPGSRLCSFLQQYQTFLP